MQRPYDSKTFKHSIIEIKLIVAQVSIAGETGIGNEAVSAYICRWKYAIKGKPYSPYKIL